MAKKKDTQVIEPNASGEASLGNLAQHPIYWGTIAPNGVVTLTPASLIPEEAQAPELVERLNRVVHEETMRPRPTQPSRGQVVVDRPVGPPVDPPSEPPPVDPGPPVNPGPPFEPGPPVNPGSPVGP